MKSKSCFAFLSLFLIPSLVQAESPCAPLVPDDICKIEQQIYIHTDFKRMEDVRSAIVRLKDLLMTHVSDNAATNEHILSLVDHVADEANANRVPADIIHSVTGKENLFAVLAKIRDWESKHGAILPLGWDLPHDILTIVASNRRVAHPALDRTQFGISLYGVLRDDISIDQIQLIQYPNKVILDKQAGIGNWNYNQRSQSRPATFSLGIDNLGESAKPGLYLMNIKIQNQPMVKGWLIMSRVQAASTPQVKSPQINEIYHTNQPTIRWKNFESDDLKPMEQRKRKIHIHDAASDEGRWFFSEIYADRSEEIKIGSPRAQGVTELRNGNYRFEISFEERRFFGGFLIGREAATQIPFSVSK